MIGQSAMALSLGGITFLLAVIWGGPLIQVLRNLGVGKKIRIEGPERHVTARHADDGRMVDRDLGPHRHRRPQSGLAADRADRVGQSILLPTLVMLGFAVLGAVDDWQGVGIAAARMPGRSFCGRS
jgi:phospho-N-acetylmuramoyl-pentapeptide-transferase